MTDTKIICLSLFPKGQESDTKVAESPDHDLVKGHQTSGCVHRGQLTTPTVLPTTLSLLCMKLCMRSHYSCSICSYSSFSPHSFPSSPMPFPSFTCHLSAYPPAHSPL